MFTSIGELGSLQLEIFCYSQVPGVLILEVLYTTLIDHSLHLHTLLVPEKGKLHF